MKKLLMPRVCIVGRTNVGKSALFNKLADDKRALVFDEIGVTRDPLVDTASWLGHTYEIIDTAGFLPTLKKEKNDIAARALLHGEKYIRSADLILFVVDALVGYVEEDIRLFSFIKKLGVPIIVVLNKVDTKKAQDSLEELLYVLQNHSYISISAAHSRGIEDLQGLIVNQIDWSRYHEEEEGKHPYFSVALLGRPNVGKSSIANILAEEEISIISDVAGTTREAISKDLYTEDNFKITISDTAGVRKSRAVEDRIEELMVSNTMRTVQKSHLVLMVIDINDDQLLDQDITLAIKAFEDFGKAILIIWNKIDLLPKNSDPLKLIKEKTLKYKHFFDIVPQIIFSAKTKRNKEKLIPEIKGLWGRYSQRIESREVYTYIKELLSQKSLFKIQQKLQIQSLHVIKTAPPTFIIKSRQYALFGKSEINFLTNHLRKKFDLKGIPVIWKINNE
jgi:GTP-binding protein